jgi:trigger factor
MPTVVKEDNKTQTIREIKIEINKDEIDQAYNNVMREIQKEFVVPGFRKGKVPFSIIENRLGQNYIFQKVVENALDQSLRDYITSLNQNVISINNLKIESATYEKIVYSFLLEVEPIIDIEDNLEVEVKKVNVDVSDEVEKRYNNLKDQYSTFSEADRGIEEGDKVDIYFEIKDSSSGVTLAGGDNNLYQVLAVKEALLPGVFENILGMKKDEEKEFEVEGPSNIEQFKDKKLKVKVKVSKVFAKNSPTEKELLDLVKYSSTEELKNDIKKVVEQDIENRQKDLIFANYLALLKEKIDFEIPQTLIQKEKEFQYQNFLNLLKQQNKTLEDYLKSTNQTKEDFDQHITNMVKENLKRSIIINNLLRKYNVTLDNMEIEYYLKNDIETQRYAFELSQMKLSNEEINYRLTQFIMMKKLKDEIAKKVKVKYVD